MTYQAREVDLESWSRAGQFHLFRTYDRPHFATTARVDVTALMTRGKSAGASPYRAFIHAIGAGVHAVPALKMRFIGDRFSNTTRSRCRRRFPAPATPSATPTFPILRTGTSFDRSCKAIIEETTRGADSRRQHRPAL
jgi:chloramphenicol O-acetyltransferase type A